MQTGIQLITLPYVHYNPAKPAHIDQDTGIFPYKVFRTRICAHDNMRQNELDKGAYVTSLLFLHQQK